MMTIAYLCHANPLKIQIGDRVLSYDDESNDIRYINFCFSCSFFALELLRENDNFLSLSETIDGANVI